MADNKFDLGRKVRALDDWAMRLWGDVVEGAEKPAFFYIDFRYNYEEEVREIEFGLNFRKKGKEGKITMFPPQTVFYSICDSLAEYSRNPETTLPTTIVWEEQSQFANGQRTDKPFAAGKIVIGIDDDGPWLSMFKKGFPATKCRFNAPMNWNLKKGTGEPFSNKETGMIMALSISDAWKEYIRYFYSARYLDDVALEKAKAAKKSANYNRMNGGGNGGGQQSGGSGNSQTPWNSPKPSGGSGGPSVEFDEDLPF